MRMPYRRLRHGEQAVRARAAAGSTGAALPRRRPGARASGARSRTRRPRLRAARPAKASSSANSRCGRRPAQRAPAAAGTAAPRPGRAPSWWPASTRRSWRNPTSCAASWRSARISSISGRVVPLRRAALLRRARDPGRVEVLAQRRGLGVRQHGLVVRRVEREQPAVAGRACSASARARATTVGGQAGEFALRRRRARDQALVASSTFSSNFACAVASRSISSPKRCLRSGGSATPASRKSRSAFSTSLRCSAAVRRPRVSATRW